MTETPNETHAFGYNSSYRVNTNAQGPRRHGQLRVHARGPRGHHGHHERPVVDLVYYPDRSLNTIAPTHRSFRPSVD